MGNCSTIQFGRRCAEFHDQKLHSVEADGKSHEGIKIVGVEKFCEFTSGSVLCVGIMTWNTKGKVSHKDISDLMLPERKFDFLVVGLQEVSGHGAGKKLQEVLEDTHILLGEATMKSLQLFLFGGKKTEDYLKDIRVDKFAVGGCGGLIGRKKGAVAIFVDFSGIRMVFISCHLSAHVHKVEERNLQCRHISHSLFSRDLNRFPRSCHLVVWLGDLNYRLEGIRRNFARKLIQKNHFNLLTKKDQLLHEARKGQIFNGYCEGNLQFKPTYKYDVGSNEYDTSHKVRVPAWTDRILFKVENNSGIDAVLSSYESVDDIQSSDHKPVKAHLCLKVNNV